MLPKILRETHVGRRKWSIGGALQILLVDIAHAVKLVVQNLIPAVDHWRYRQVQRSLQVDRAQRVSDR